MRVHRSAEGTHTLHGSPDELRQLASSLTSALEHVAELDKIAEAHAMARGQSPTEARVHGDVSVPLPGHPADVIYLLEEVTP